jgi:micrococcal nuclease
VTEEEKYDDIPWSFQACAFGPGCGAVDGDTLDLRIDLGFRVDRRVRVRLKNIDTAEIHNVSHSSDEYRRGKAQHSFVQGFLDSAREKWQGDWPLRLNTEQDTAKYGRWLATVRRRYDGVALGEALVDSFGEEIQSIE